LIKDSFGLLLREIPLFAPFSGIFRYSTTIWFDISRLKEVPMCYKDQSTEGYQLSCPLRRLTFALLSMKVIQLWKGMPHLLAAPDAKV